MTKNKISFHHLFTGQIYKQIFPIQSVVFFFFIRNRISNNKKIFCYNFNIQNNNLS